MEDFQLLPSISQTTGASTTFVSQIKRKALTVLSTVLVCLMFITNSNAQLADGSICPDFTGTDIDGNTWNLYDILDSGKPCIIEISATWCGPCWGYHTSNALKTLYNQYGPSGTNELMVLFIEGDNATTMADLLGTTSGTQGDWVTGTPFPIIDDGSVADVLGISYFPTIYTVCPNRMITETGQIPTADHYAFIQQNICGSASQQNDAIVFNLTAESVGCGENEIAVNLQNFGLGSFTSATVELMNGATSLETKNWTGNLATYQTATIQFAPVSGVDPMNLAVNITSSDDDATNNMVEKEFTPVTVADATSTIRIELSTDMWGEETGWKLINLNTGATVASANAGSYGDDEQVVENIEVPALACYAFRITDTYGDGMHGGQYPIATGGGIDGSCLVTSRNLDSTEFSVIFDYDGSYDFTLEEAFTSVNFFTSSDDVSNFSAVSVYPNPTSGSIKVDLSTVVSSEMTVELVNLLGEVVMRDELGYVVAGNQSLNYDLQGLETGVYFLKLASGESVSTVRVTFVK
jgi:Secretion system C-terminal sorting domain/AhpC/TSA family